MRRLYPPPAVDLTDAQVGDAYAFPTDRAWLRANMVSTLDGAMRGPDGSSRTISSPVDQRVFAVARQGADAILVGAGTIRAEDYRPSRRVVAIVTARLHLPLTLRMFAERTAEHARPIVLTTDESERSAPAELRAAADIVACGSGRVDLAAGLAHLASRGLRHVHCEGGPSLLSAIVEADLLDELLLTLVPSFLGGGGREHVISVAGGLDPARRMRPAEILTEDGTVLWRGRRPGC